MKSFSVIIPSKTASNFLPCAEAVRRCEPLAPIHLIDDGMDLSWLPREDLMPCLGHTAPKPFIFARNCNLGIAKAGQDDVVLLNDDALLQTPEGFSQLQKLAEDHPEFGIIAPVTNVTGQPLQQPHGVGLREVPHIAFVCVYIPRRTIETVGLLDERYCIDYGVEDLDYCHMVRKAGLKVGVFDHCFVDHGSLVSSFRGDPRTPKSYAQNLALFNQKWGLASA
jgi:GT2 family glycosyltransferase